MRTIALLALAIAGVGAFGGCASDSNSGVHTNRLVDGGTCNVAYCVSPVAGAQSCCINNHCGVDLGNGCIDLGRRDGG